MIGAVRRVLVAAIWGVVALAFVACAEEPDDSTEEPDCTRSSECRVGMRCLDGRCMSTPCGDDLDCASDAVCTDGVCGPPFGEDPGTCAGPDDTCSEDSDCAPYGVCDDCQCLVDHGCERPHSVAITSANPPLDQALAAGSTVAFSATGELTVPAEFAHNRGDAYLSVTAFGESGGGTLGRLCDAPLDFGGTQDIPAGGGVGSAGCTGTVPVDARTISLYVEFAACNENFWTKVTWQVL